MVGKRLSHYRIEARLGRGGMGEVLLARDLALGRAVAIKVLPEQFDPELKRRLLIEASASRSLQHPGIATFYEAGEADGIAFIAMEYVRGATLRDELRRCGALPAPRALALAGGLLEALVHAHAAGVVHRDIKPENIMVTGDQQAKLLDFGLAYRLPSAADSAADTAEAWTRLTETGQLLGSFGYMAPEQLRGEPVDAGTDLFAMGAVLHEMLSGRPAFDGATPAVRIAAALFGEPAPLPPEAAALQGVVSRALAKARDQRYRSAAEFLRDLRRLGEGQAVATFPDTLAVLDFANRSGDPADAWIGKGIADSLTTDLGRFAGVGLVPRARVARVAANGQAEPAAIGALLGCRWALSGSYQRVGERLRILMDLTHVPTEQVTMTEKVDGPLDEIFALQDRLGGSAAAALQLRDRAPEATTRAAPALGAYECLTRGQQQWMRMTKGGMDQAQELLEEALRQQPDYPDALAWLAAVHDMRFTFTTDPAELGHAVAHARRATELAPGHAAARVWLAYALWRSGTHEQALEAIERAAELDPGNHYPWYFWACFLISRGEAERAIPIYQKAVANGPSFGFGWVGLGYAHMEVEAYGESMWSLARGIELEQGGAHATAGAACYLGECLRRQGRLDEARERCLAGLEAVERTDHMYRDTYRSLCLVALGRTARDQGDGVAAQTAYRQSELHLEGRPRTLGGGWLLAQTLAGRAAAESDPAGLDRARELLRRRDRLDWSWLWGCDATTTAADLERAARVLGRPR